MNSQLRKLLRCLPSVLLVVVAAAAAIAATGPRRVARDDGSASATGAASPLLSPELLQSGDLILIRGQSIYSQAVRALDRSSRWTHVGMVNRIGEQVYVIDASPDEQAAGSPNGRTRRQRVEDYLAARLNSTVAVYRVDAAEAVRDAAAEQCKLWAEAEVPFDSHFDADSSTELYCSEMVWRAYLTSGLDLAEDRWQHVKLLWLEDAVLFPDALVQSPYVHYLGHLRMKGW